MLFFIFVNGSDLFINFFIEVYLKKIIKKNFVIFYDYFLKLVEQFLFLSFMYLNINY